MPNEITNEKITQLKKSEKRNEKTYIFQLHDYLTIIARRLQGELYRTLYNIIQLHKKLSFGRKSKYNVYYIRYLI